MRLNDELDNYFKNKISFDKDKKIITEQGEPYILDYITSKIKRDGRLFLIFPNNDLLLLSEKNFISNNIEVLKIEKNITKNNIYQSGIKNIVKKIFDDRKAIVLCTLDIFSANLPVIDEKDSIKIELKKNNLIDITKIVSLLLDSGYIRTSQVSAEGEFAIKGEVIDIFFKQKNKPHRIYINWDKIEKICEFDVYNQKTTENSIDKISVSEYRCDKENEQTNIEHYIGKNDNFVLYYGTAIENACEKYEDEFKNAKIFLDNNQNKISAIYYEIAENRKDSILIQSTHSNSYFGNFNAFSDEIENLLKENYRIYIYSDGIIQTERIKALLREKINAFDELLDKKIKIESSEISGGFTLEKKIAVFNDREIFNRKSYTGRNIVARLQSTPLESFIDLKEGDLVVHINYGIGKFVSIERIVMDNTQRDYIKIEFADKEFYYVPLEKANLVQKYIGKADVKLDSMHSSTWRKKKEKALENAKKFAEDLLKIYALRSKKNAFQHIKDTPWQLIFESGFEFEETQDQINAINDVKKDMESNTIMDRIIVGDVGFGKTEIAFRAAFKAIMSGRQVCFLSPTTILCAQHYRNFKTRCEGFPVNIRQYSRIISRKEATKTLEEINNAQADIVFSTHKILSDKVNFRRLGLLIIDEEQRFGVRDKERIKFMKSNVDTLTLSATPIPRTLYMSLLKIRSISTLKTPPARRIAANINIGKYDEDIIKSAIEFEIKRGGQVYYLHNNTKDIGIVATRIKKIVENAKVDIVNGKMKPEEIENAIFNFANGYTDVLVSTTIIENGIDIPNANTLIVDDATLYGTAQLYQIKGRIGRSEKQSFAYLFYPKDKSVSEEAILRIKVISENSSLGSGFNIAMNDLMMRGAGNILGKEQSGHIEEVGLDMYMHLLDLSVRRLEGEKEVENTEDDEVSININYTAYIPDDYIRETETKFRLYKQIANTKTIQELEDIIGNVKDKYGDVPTPFSNLYVLARLKITMKKLRIREIKQIGENTSAEFEKVNMINVDKMLSLIKKYPSVAKLDAKRPNCLLISTKGINDEYIADFILDKIEQLL